MPVRDYEGKNNSCYDSILKENRIIALRYSYTKILPCLIGNKDTVGTGNRNWDTVAVGNRSLDTVVVGNRNWDTVVVGTVVADIVAVGTVVVEN